MESRPVWAALVLLALGCWARRSRRAVAAGNWPAAFALTGLTACLVSPITWVHHLVWLLPSFAVLVRAGHPRVAGALYAVPCTSVVWLWFARSAAGPPTRRGPARGRAGWAGRRRTPDGRGAPRPR